MNKSRKATLIHILAGIGHGGRSPGQEVAIQMALALIKRTSIADLGKIAKRIKDADIFWAKQW